MYLYDAYRTARAPAAPRAVPAIRPYQLPPQTTEPLVPTDPWGRTPSAPGFSMSAWYAIAMLARYDFEASKYIVENWPRPAVRAMSTGGALVDHTCSGGAGGHVYAGFAPGCPTTVAGSAWRTPPGAVANISATFVKTLPFDQIQCVTNYVWVGFASPARMRNVSVMQLPIVATSPDTRADGRMFEPPRSEAPSEAPPRDRRPRKNEREKKLRGGAAAALALRAIAAFGAANSAVGAFYYALPARLRRGGRLGAAAQFNRVVEHFGELDWGKVAANLLKRKLLMRAQGAAWGGAYRFDPRVAQGLNNYMGQSETIRIHGPG